MVVNLNEYLSIKNSIINRLSNHHNEVSIVNAMKNKHKDCVSSNRKSESIDTPGKLLKVLEKRCCLTANYIKPLEDIVILMNSPPELMKCVQEFNRCLKHSENIKNLMCKNYLSSRTNSPTKSELQKEKRAKINKLISEEIGRHWKILSRNLMIKESIIDILDEKYPNDIQLKTLEMLHSYESQTDSSKWYNNLCNALKESRRNDLKLKIRDIYSGASHNERFA